MVSRFRRCLPLLAAVLLSAPAIPAPGATPSDDVLAVWRLLDYIGVDYREAVRDGAVINPDEYAEMLEFTGEVERRLPSLPPSESQDALRQLASALSAAVRDRADPPAVAAQAVALAKALLGAYPVTLAPGAPPDVAAAGGLYLEHCAACHGERGRGDGPAARGMEPPPVNFHEAARQRERSVFALHGIITNGVEGTAMAGYGQLEDAQRWALAFHVGQMIYSDADRERGRHVWRDAARGREQVPDLAALTSLTPAQLEAALGGADGRALTAYLRAKPDAVMPVAADALAQARDRIAQSARAHAQGRNDEAIDLALGAYLDGFEPLEPAIAARDPAVVHDVEAAMIAFRASLQSGTPESVQENAQRVAQALQRAGDVLARGEASGAGAFASSFVILFREGLEAMLVLVAIVAGLRRTGRLEAMPYVHAGWIAALALGLATWVAATWMITISGAQRELTEGITGLVAVAVLVFVGLWLHSQSLSGRWQVYIQQAIQAHLSRNRLWGLGLLAFVAVYREVFETVLFYRALWEQGAHAQLLAGIGAAAGALVAVGVLLFRAGARLPIRQFFAASSVLIGGLAVVLAGKAAAALQEAGWLGVTPWRAPTLDWLGVYPTAQTLGFQGAIVALVMIGVWANRRVARAAA